MEKNGFLLNRNIFSFVILLLMLAALTETSLGQRVRRLDFDGDGRTDRVVMRRDYPGFPIFYYAYKWIFLRSTDGFPQTATWGIEGDVLVPADYDGDGKTDIAVWRPGATGRFYIMQSRDGYREVALGKTGCEPRVVDDYDRDGLADPAVYCFPDSHTSMQGTWTYEGRRWGRQTIVWGEIGDIPIPGDYDGDRAADFVVARVRIEPPYNEPYVTFHLNQTLNGFRTYEWGWGGLQYGTWAVPGDYDGDNKTDFALAVRVAYSNRTFLTVRPSGGGVPLTQNFPGLGDIEKSENGVLALGDYDDDRRTDSNVIFNSRPLLGYSYFRGFTSSGIRFGYDDTGLPGFDTAAFRYGDYPLAVGNVRRLYCRELCDTVPPW